MTPKQTRAVRASMKQINRTIGNVLDVQRDLPKGSIAHIRAGATIKTLEYAWDYLYKMTEQESDWKDREREVIE